MALEDILKKIKEDSRKEVERIKKEAGEEAERVFEEAGGKIDSIKEKIRHDAQISLQDEKKRILTMANLEARKKVLEKKQDLVEEAFQKALNYLKHLSDKEYKRTIKELLLRTAESGEEEIVISLEEKRLTSVLLNEVNETLSSKGKLGKLKLSPERRKFQGGFILKAGRKEINNTFNSFFQEKREELEAEVAGILFQAASHEP